MELWVESAIINGYADDTISSFSSSNEDEIVGKLEEDACRILKFMASNHLTANANKTGFMIIRAGGQTVPRSVTIGPNVVHETNHHKILGVVVNNNLSWKDHAEDILPSINQRIGLLKRLSHQIPRKYLPQIANSIITTKARYGLAIFGSVRLCEEDPKVGFQQGIQVALNTAMRIVSGKRLIDRIPVESLSEATGIRSLNRMCTEDRLMMMWKSSGNIELPMGKIFDKNCGHPSMASRSKSNGKLPESARTTMGRRNLPHVAIELWNKIDRIELRSKLTKRSAKNYIRQVALDFPF